jgi:O-antigen ligase
MLAADNPLNLSTISTVVVVLGVLLVPLLLRWHHAWLIAAWNTTAILFFMPGKPPIWMGLAAASLAISVLQYTLNRQMKFLPVPAVTRPLIFLTAVILVTARLTGGLGVRALGGDTYGGKRYFIVLAAVLGFFAIINRRIPPRRANLYVALFFLGAATMMIGELPGRVPSALNFLFLIFPVTSLSAFVGQNSVIEQAQLMSRIGGLASLGNAFFCAMLARYGIRGVLDTTKPGRVAAFGFFILIAVSTGFRSALLTFLVTFALLFYLERLHHTRLLLPVVFVSLAGVGLMGIFAVRLPLSFQRSLSVLPFIQVDPLARMSAQVSSDWRLQMWREVIPQIPEYLIIGKGYSYSGSEQAKMGKFSMEAMEMVGDYHNGPLSVLLPFGIFGMIAFVWLMVAGIRVVHQNYRFGDPAFHNINTFLFAYFVAKVFFFFTAFGSLHSDLHLFLGLLALSISLNGGVAKPAVVPQPKVVFNRFRLHPSARPPVGA